MFSLQSVLPIEILLQKIVNQYFINLYCLTIVAEAPIECLYPVSFTYITVLNENLNLTNQILESSEIGCSDYIVRVREPEMFMVSFEEVNQLGNMRRSDRKILLLPFDEDNFQANNLLNVLSLIQTRFVANLLMIIPSANASDIDCQTYDLVTHKYVGSDEEISQPAYLDQWSSCTQKFRENVNLFPHDMSNLYGKTVKVAAITDEPYTILDIEESVEPSGRDGIEVRLIEEFCRWVNCTVDIIRNDDAYQWGEVYTNRTGVGLLGNLLADRADIGIGFPAGLYYWYDEYVYFDFTTTTLRSTVTCVAPSPRIIASWETPLMPFSLNMWIALLCTFIFASICLTIVKRGSTDGVLLITFGMLITQSQTDPAVGRTWRIRSVTAWLLVSGLVIDNAYGGGLASVFTVPTYEPSIDTIQDLVDKRMEWGGTEDIWIFSLSTSTEPLIKQLVSLFRVKPADELKELSLTRKMAYSFEKLSGGSFAIGDYITKEALINLSTMTEDFYYGYCVIMLRKSSAYTDKLSQLIGRLHESGLLIAWENQVALNYLNYEVQLTMRLSRSRKDMDTVEPLYFRQLVGVFYIYALGVLISIVTFIVELLWNRQGK